jgi:hypothetical protein
VEGPVSKFVHGKVVDGIWRAAWMRRERLTMIGDWQGLRPRGDKEGRERDPERKSEA